MRKLFTLIAAVMLLTLAACDEWTNPIATSNSTPAGLNVDSVKAALLSGVLARPVAIADTEWFWSTPQSYESSESVCQMEWAIDAKRWVDTLSVTREPWTGADTVRPEFWRGGFMMNGQPSGTLNNGMYAVGKARTLCYRVVK